MCFLDDSHVKKQNDKLAREAQVAKGDWQAACAFCCC